MTHNLVSATCGSCSKKLAHFMLLAKTRGNYISVKSYPSLTFSKIIIMMKCSLHLTFEVVPDRVFDLSFPELKSIKKFPFFSKNFAYKVKNFLRFQSIALILEISYLFINTASFATSPSSCTGSSSECLCADDQH